MILATQMYHPMEPLKQIQLLFFLILPFCQAGKFEILIAAVITHHTSQYFSCLFLLLPLLQPKKCGNKAKPRLLTQYTDHLFM